MKKILFLLTLFFVFNTISAQKISYQDVDSKGRIIFAKIEDGAKQNIISLLKTISNLKDDWYTFRQEDSFIDEEGNEHIHYRLYYAGIFVKGMDYAVHFKGQNIDFINGGSFELLDKDITPKADEKNINLKSNLCILCRISERKN